MLPATGDEAKKKKNNEVTVLTELPVLLGRQREVRRREVKLLA